MIHITISADVGRVSLEDATKLTALLKEISQIPTITVVATVDNSDVTLAGSCITASHYNPGAVIIMGATALKSSNLVQAVEHLGKLEMPDVVMASIERSEEEIVDALKQLSDSVQEMPFNPATAEIRDKQQQNRRRQNYHSKHHKK